jgi:stress response protein YsnF
MTWSITGMKTLDVPEEGTIVVASFTVTDGTSTVSSDTKLLEADAESFVPLAEITEEQVIGFVKDALEEQQVAVYEAMVAERTAAVQPQVVDPLPWNS